MDRHDGFLVRPSSSSANALLWRSSVLTLAILMAVFSGPLPSLVQAQQPPGPGRAPAQGPGQSRQPAEPQLQTQPHIRASANAIAQSVQAKLDTRGDLTLKETSITDAIYLISQTWGVNIVVQSNISGQVNGVFKQAPLREILDSLLLINGYSYRPVGESLVIMTLEDVGEVPPLFTSAIVPLRYGAPEEILPVVQILKSPRGRVQAIPSSRSLMVVDFPHHVELIKKSALELDRAASRRGTARTASSTATGGPLDVAYYAPQYVRALDLEKMVANLMSAEGKASVIEKENRIVVADHPENLRIIGESIKQIDIPRSQVRIAALIYDISLEDIEEIGINWNSALKGNNLDANNDPQDVFAIDSITQVPPALGAANGIMTFMSLSRNFDVTAVVNALQESDDSRLLADPNVMVLDNDMASIQIVTEIPYQELTQTSGGGNIGTTSFREAGIKLQVSPHIAADGTIEMLVTPSFSRLTGFTPNDNQPIIDRREATTTIRVADQQTIVIGGLRQRSDVGDFTGIPLLKDIPVAGKLFRNRKTTVRESELVVFITPMIVPCDDHPQGRYGAALETTNCWLHRVPWAEGCPPVGHPGYGECYDEHAHGHGYGHGHEHFGPGHHGPEYHGHEEYQYEQVVPELNYDEAPKTERLPEVVKPPLPPQASTKPNTHITNRRQPPVAVVDSPGAAAKIAKALPQASSRRAAPASIAKPNVAPSVKTPSIPKTPSTERLPQPKPQRIQLADERSATPVVKENKAPAKAERLPPVIKLTKYQTAVTTQPPRRDATPDRVMMVNPARDRGLEKVHIPTNTLRSGVSPPLRAKYEDRYRADSHREGKTLIRTEAGETAPRVARNPSVSPEEHRRATGEKSSVLDIFKP